jgi:hypothetical protein
MKENGYDKLGQVISRTRSASCSEGKESPSFGFYILLQSK